MTPYQLAAIVQEAYLDEMPDVIDDPDAVTRWPRDFLLREIATAQRQACLRRDLRHLFDDTTDALCTIALTAGQASYALDARVLRVARAAMDGISLAHVTREWLERTRAPSATAEIGTPRVFYITGRTLSLFPVPLADGTLNLAVWRLPLADPDLDDDLEWPGEQEPLAHWVAYRAFLRPNGDTFDEKFAKVHLDLFEQVYGPAVPEPVRAELLVYPDTLNLLSSPTLRRSRADW